MNIFGNKQNLHLRLHLHDSFAVKGNNKTRDNDGNENDF